MFSKLNATTKSRIRKNVLGPTIWFINCFVFLIFKILPKNIWSLDRPIFIIGCPRSGTSILVEMFSKHKQIANWSEAGQILQLRYYGQNIGHLLEEKDLNSFDVSRIMLFFKLFTILARKKRFVNKSPRNSLRIRYLKCIYPNALFIHLVRDGRAVIFSSTNQTREDMFRQDLPFGGFCKPPNWRKYLNVTSLLIQFAYQWIEIEKYIKKTASKFLTDKNYLMVKYEDFCENPYSVLDQMDKFSGLSKEGRHLAIPKHLQSQNFKWKTNLTESEIVDIEKVIGDYLLEYGYKLSF